MSKSKRIVSALIAFMFCAALAIGVAQEVQAAPAGGGNSTQSERQRPPKDSPAKDKADNEKPKPPKKKKDRDEKRHYKKLPACPDGYKPDPKDVKNGTVPCKMPN